MMPDNWKHRSENMLCKTCMFFVPKVPKQVDVVEELRKKHGFVGNPINVEEALPLAEQVHLTTHLGRCRRHAPTLAGWPVVFATDWCGDNKIDEEKLHGSG
jgi:hypothetical protein